MAGMGANVLRSTPLSLIQDWSIEAQLATEDGETMALELDQAIVLYKNNEATFIDARDKLKFRESHIKGALNLPWHDVQEQFMAVAPQINPDGLVITYCDGNTCTLSHDLAFFLKEMGFNVKVMSGGWEAWLDADMPVESTEENHQSS
jgi:rhodanese-related sulfurtransferase